MNEYVAEFIKPLSTELGSDLTAAYFFGSAAQGKYRPDESDINLFLVLTEDADIHRLRQIFAPVWQEKRTQWKRPPVIARENAFLRHLTLHPALARTLKQQAQPLIEERDYLNGLPLLDPRAEFVQLAQEAMSASLALAPQLLAPAEIEQKLVQLRRLARRIHGGPIPDGESAANLLGRVHMHLRQMEVNQPQIQPWQAERRPTTSLLLPSLRATYKKPEKQWMIMVFSSLTPEQIINTDWDQIASRLSGRFQGLQITTATQLRLIVELNEATAVPLRRYDHEWGLDPLSTLSVTQSQIMLDAARLPSQIQVDLLPSAFLTAVEDDLPKLIHDFQNKMLNIQLEHELLHRIEKIDKFVPPEPLPGRETPPLKRIDALFKHFGWWADYYAQRGQRLS